VTDNSLCHDTSLLSESVPSIAEEDLAGGINLEDTIIKGKNSFIGKIQQLNMTFDNKNTTPLWEKQVILLASGLKGSTIIT
jgi:hypothetical protein